MTDRDSGFGASGVENSQNPETETGAEAVVDEEVKGGSGRAFPLITPSRATDAPPSESQPLPQPQPQSQSQLEPDSPVSPRHGGIRRRRRADIDSGDADADADADDDNNDNDDVPTTDPAHPHSDLHFPPSIRVISVEAERESQKVRSLYETTGGLNWEDGKRPASHDGRLESQVDVPSNGDENDAYGFLEHNPPFIYL